MSNIYAIDYKNENDFRKKERAIKKYNLFAYKKLVFEIYPALKEGNFIGTLVSRSNSEEIDEYELILPTDSMFAKVHGTLTLHYTVLKKENIVKLNDLTPGDILLEAHNNELTTYKGVPISKSHTEKDMLKINLLNSMMRDKF